MVPQRARGGSGSASMLGFVFLDLAQQVGSALQCLSQFDAGATLPLFDCCDPVRRGSQVRHEALFDIALRLHTRSTGRSLDSRSTSRAIRPPVRIARTEMGVRRSPSVCAARLEMLRRGPTRQAAVLTNVIIQRGPRVIQRFAFTVQFIAQSQELLFEADTDPFVQSLPNCVKSCIGPVVLPLQACTRCTLHDPPMFLFKR